jgi:hypothetical protein
MLHTSEGRTEEAWQDLLACHRLGRLVGRGGTGVEVLVGIAINSIASFADEAFLDSARLNAKQARLCLRDLQQLPPLPSVADSTDLFERFMLLDILLKLDRGGIELLQALAGTPPGHGPDSWGQLVLDNADWDTALRTVNSWYDRIVASLRVKDRAERQKQLAALAEELGELRTAAADTGELAELIRRSDKPAEAVGKALTDVVVSGLLSSFLLLQRSADRSEQAQRNLQVAFALEAYRKEHGAYPKELAELAPKYLPQVPDDLFSGKPLIYRRAQDGYLLYSVGPNGKDDEGRGRDDMPPGDDLSIRMPLPELKAKQE